MMCWMHTHVSFLSEEACAYDLWRRGWGVGGLARQQVSSIRVSRKSVYCSCSKLNH